MGFGGIGRAWSHRHIGLQLEVSHYSMTSAVEPGRLTATQFGPSLLYSMRDHVSDTLWLRPYIGAGADWAHSSLSVLGGLSTSANTLGARAFVGGEVTFSNLPQFALSVDTGYYHRPSPFIGFEPKGFGASVAAYWYVKYRFFLWKSGSGRTGDHGEGHVRKGVPLFFEPRRTGRSQATKIKKGGVLNDATTSATESDVLA